MLILDAVLLGETVRHAALLLLRLVVLYHDPALTVLVLLDLAALDPAPENVCCS